MKCCAAVSLVLVGTVLWHWTPLVAGEKSRPAPALRSTPDVTPPEFDVGAQTATHRELDPLPIEFQELTCLRLAPDGRLAAGDRGAKQVKVIDSTGKVAAVVETPFGPEALDFAADGTIYCGGQGRLAKFDSKGLALETVEVPKDLETPITEVRRAGTRPMRLSGIAVSKDAVFVAFGSGWSLGSKSKLFRFDLDLENPKLLAEGLRGCCQRCDIAVRDGVLYLAENSAHRVVRYDREGNVLSKWGQRGRTELENFGSCCNPMNLAFDAQGTLYTAESGLGRVKRYTTDGKYLGLVGYVGVERFTLAGPLAASCSNIAIAVTPEGDRVYVTDIKINRIRVLQKKG